MRRCARRTQRPPFVATTRDHRYVRIPRSVLEADGGGGPLRRLHESAASLRERRPGVLLVAVVHDADVHAVEQPPRAERAQSRDDDDVTTLHVDDAGAPSGGIVQPLKMLEGAARLENGVEMADEEQLRAGPRMF